MNKKYGKLREVDIHKSLAIGQALYWSFEPEENTKFVYTYILNKYT